MVLYLSISSLAIGDFSPHFQSTSSSCIINSFDIVSDFQVFSCYWDRFITYDMVQIHVQSMNISRNISRISRATSNLSQVFIKRINSCLMINLSLRWIIKGSSTPQCFHQLSTWHCAMRMIVQLNKILTQSNLSFNLSRTLNKILGSILARYDVLFFLGSDKSKSTVCQR